MLGTAVPLISSATNTSAVTTVFNLDRHRPDILLNYIMQSEVVIQVSLLARHFIHIRVFSDMFQQSLVTVVEVLKQLGELLFLRRVFVRVE